MTEENAEMPILGSQYETDLKSKIRNLKWLGLSVLTFVLVMAGDVAHAQQQPKVSKIGWLGGRYATAPGLGNFRRELSALNYEEGKNIKIESRYADSKLDRLPALADELVRLKVDVLVAAALNEALAAKSATKTIPIVFSGSGDPVAAGLVDSLPRPGGNLTGFTTIGAVLAGKRLELLKEAIPGLSRVGVLWDPNSVASAHEWKESQLPGRELGLKLHPVEVSSADKLEKAFGDAANSHSAALYVISSPFMASNQKRIVDMTAQFRLPAIYPDVRWAATGGLMSYGADRAEPYRRIAWMVDKILKGAKPADIPIEQPTTFELVINLKTAKSLGLTIPPVVMMRAVKVIR